MFDMLKTKRNFSQASRIALIACACAVFLTAGVAHADPTSSISSYALQQALAADNHVDVYAATNHTGFNIGSSYFSGPASGVTPPENFSAFNNNDQQLYALLVDGRYDFNADNSSISSLPVHPYVMGGMGVATTGQTNFNAQGGGTVPLFRLGGGVAYRLDQQWNLSLDYKAGFATPTAGDQVFTNRGNQPVDLQSLNVGMSYAF